MLLLMVIFCWDFFWADGYTVYPDYFIVNFLHILVFFFAFVDCCGRDMNVCWTRPLGWTSADVLVVKSCVPHYLLSFSQAIQFSSEFSFYGCNK